MLPQELTLARRISPRKTLGRTGFDSPPEHASYKNVARSFGKVLSDLKLQHRRRVVVLKNNQVEAVIVPVDDYEMMAEALALLEHMEIYQTVKQRARRKGKKHISLEALLKEQRLAV